jgi:hypothetical protein
VLTASTVTASLTGSSFAGTGGFDISNYSDAGTIQNSSSRITARPLTIALANQTRVYDGSANISLDNGQFTTSNFATGEGASINTLTGTYNSKDVLTANTVTASLTGGSFAGTGGFNVNNYSFSGSIQNTSSHITPAPLTVTLAAQSKTYDGTTADTTVSSTDFTIDPAGFIGSEQGKITPAGGTVVYNFKNASTNAVNPATLVTATLSGGLLSDAGSTGFIASNYSLPSTITAAGVISARALTISLASQSKVYDGATAIALDNGQFSIANLATGESATINPLIAAYDSKDVLAAGTVTASLTNASFSGSGGFDVNNYSYGAMVQNGASHITPRTINGGLSAQTKVYDATTAALGLTPAMFSLAGFAAGEGASLINHASGTYNSKNVPAAAEVTVTAIAVGDYAGSGGFVASNYALPTAIAGPGTITPAPLSVTNLGVKDKVYDGTTAAQLDLSRVTASSLTGVFAGDDVSLSSLPGGATFATPNVGTNIHIALSGQAITGADASNYALSSSALPTANITQRPLTATIVGTPTKVYDGETGASLMSANFQLSNFVSGEGAGVTQTIGTYSAADAGARTVTARLAIGDFTAEGATLLSNYILPNSASGAGVITPRPLTAVIVDDPSKYFDGNANATLTPDNFVLTGFVGGQGAAIDVTTGTYSGLGPGTNLTITAKLGPGDFTFGGGANAANYILPTDAIGPGVIRPPLSSDLSTRYEAQAEAAGIPSTPQVASTIRSAVFAMATPRVYIPFPAPGALSTWKGNGFGSLPIVVDPSTDYATQVSSDGNVAVQSGPPMINSTEQVLLQGVRNKQYRIILPPQASNGLGLATQ